MKIDKHTKIYLCALQGIINIHIKFVQNTTDSL